MDDSYMTDTEDIEFIRGRANQLIPPTDERTICDVVANGLIVNIYLRNPRPEEIAALSPGHPAEVGLYEYRGILVLLLNFGDIIITECPIRLRPGKLPLECPKTPGISIILTDLNDNIVRSVRFLSVRPSFWGEIYKRLTELEQMKYTMSKQKTLEEFALEVPGDKWEKAILRHKII
uniref:hypothetical protein n=1 Tax=Lachnoclostridium phocaeense TaxID=1871021 RepID=UPI0026DCB706|nr:hypothetical protein [Lachnoclostridium phocaeense]